jgi:hypothetical protein
MNVLTLTHYGTDSFINPGDIFYDIKEKPIRYQVANAVLGCVPDFMLCELDLLDDDYYVLATSNQLEDIPKLPNNFVRAYLAGGMDDSRVRFNGNVSEIYYVSEDRKIIDDIPLDLTELPIGPPIGQFILDQGDIKPVMTLNGAYYHYVDVCKLLKRFNGSI